MRGIWLLALALASAAAYEVCPAGHACFDGAATPASPRGWFADSYWSLLSVPSYPALVRVDGAASLASPTQGAAKEVVVAKGSSLVVSMGSALRLGPTVCDETQTPLTSPRRSWTVCVKTTSCAASEFELWPRTQCEDRVCAITVCQGDQYEVEAPAAVRQALRLHSALPLAIAVRVRRTNTASDRGAPRASVRSWFTVRVPRKTRTSDRVCSPVALCATDGSQYESVAPSSTSNRSAPT